MSLPPNVDAERAEELIETLGSFAYDPLAFVMWAFPWGEEGTELANEDGPDEWQTWVLCQVRDGLITTQQAIRIAVTSGHGVGKSALVAWLLWWAYSTFPGTRGVVTANTENQLKTKTWVEIAKWHRLFIARHLFKCTATALFATDEDQAREWRIDIVPWSERNTEAFAGLHNAGKRIIIVFDEASAIHDVIWETTEGATTDEDTEIMWFCFGNPTRQTGRFRECFPGGKFAKRWITREVDSRSVRRTNKKQFEDWIEDYGLDSDFVRVRVLGKFPKSDAESFIDRDDAVAASVRALPVKDPRHHVPWPKIIGVDPARFGDDRTVIYPREGPDARSRKPDVYTGLTVVQIAQRVMLLFNELRADAIMVDETGLGAGVVDLLRSWDLPVYGVIFGARADGFDPSAKYMNKRAEIWGMMRNWIKHEHGCIPEKVAGEDFPEELAGPTYTVNDKSGIQLEPKSMMKTRGVRSPDVADALACTFAFPIESTGFGRRKREFASDYDVMAQLLEDL